VQFVGFCTIVTYSIARSLQAQIDVMLIRREVAPRPWIVAEQLSYVRSPTRARYRGAVGYGNIQGLRHSSPLHITRGKAGRQGNGRGGKDAKMVR
jgi:hypothetical protein